ncbi:MAG: NAD(P)H-hydrate dehydratase [Gemmatimonadetes bacterium]|nr:NAD(P)H-hydrate dehydratase [Gemmatimonadota bacterium]
MSAATARARKVTPALLRSLALPRPDQEGDKETRGRVMVVGGAVEMSGALVLAGIAALRAGAGKLQLATCESIVPVVGVTVPEALVVRLPETREGGIDPRAAKTVTERGSRVDALLLGPGMMDEEAVVALARRVLAELDGPAVVLDAAATSVLRDVPDALHRLEGRAVVTPHAGEMAQLLGLEKEEVSADPLAVARRAAAELRCVVALKGSETYVVAPEGEAYRYDSGGVGLATSGSGDTLAGIVAGLAARGADPVRAAVWGVALHGGAGNVLAKRMGPLGFLARELLDEIPGVMTRLSRRGGR